jgi:DNA repair exonuclease SbcCD ATPase subunit
VNQPCKLCGTILDQEKIQTTIQNLAVEKDVIDAKIAVFNSDIKQKQESIVLIEDKLEQIAPAYTESVLYNIESDIQNLKERKDEIQKSEFQSASFQDINFDLDVEKLVKAIKASEQEVATATEDLKYYSFWEEGFGKKGLVVYLLEQMIRFLNNKVEFYLNILSKGQIRLEFDKYLDFKISGLNYRNCSSGERKRVDLAVLLALYDLTNLRNKQSFNILILDEVLDSIDKAGVEAVKDLLLELNKRIPTILVISHNNYLAEYFPTTVTVVKENGISRIE